MTLSSFFAYSDFFLSLSDANAKGMIGVTGFLLSMVMLHLLENKRLNKQMSSYQMFRIVMETLAHSNWETKGVLMQKDADAGETV